MPSPTRPQLEFVWKLHKALWRLTGGRIGTRAAGLPVLELTTTGRRSGRPRSVLLNYLDHDDGWVVIASNAGDHRPPAWWLNLEADASAVVTRKGVEHPVEARRAEGEEREVFWSRAAAANPGYEEYAAAAGREIPVVVLERTG